MIDDNRLITSVSELADNGAFPDHQLVMVSDVVNLATRLALHKNTDEEFWGFEPEMDGFMNQRVDEVSKSQFPNDYDRLAELVEAVL